LKHRQVGINLFEYSTQEGSSRHRASLDSSAVNEIVDGQYHQVKQR